MVSMCLFLLLVLFVLSGCGGRLFLAAPGMTARDGLALVKGGALVEIVGEGVRANGALGAGGAWTYRFREKIVTLRADGTMSSRPRTVRSPEALLGGWRLDSPQALSMAQKHGLARSEYRLVLRGEPARWEIDRFSVDALTGLAR